jgi:site-specific DNA-methyltransferase (adenine-specific)
MEKTKVTYMDVDSLIPYANNPRLNDNAVDAVAASIKEFGFKVPIVVDGENVIINGHTRLKAAHKLRLKQVPVIVADDLTPRAGEGVPSGRQQDWRACPVGHGEAWHRA